MIQSAEKGAELKFLTEKFIWRRKPWLKNPEKGWFEKEKDNVRVTKYYRTQKEAIEAAKTHIKNSGLAGSIVIQSKTGKIRANTKVSKKK